MTSKSLTFPIKKVGKDEWLDLTAHGLSHEFVAEKVFKKNENFSFGGGHRVRHYSFRKNVHWRVSVGVEVDIADVAVDDAPPRRHTARKKT
jgi:hypothetical protein